MHIERGRKLAMPATTPKKVPFPEVNEKEQKQGGYSKPTYVRCDLNSEQKTEMATWSNARNSDECMDYLFECIQDGYTFGLKEAEVGYQASLTQMRQPKIGVQNMGKCLVTRASTPERALWSLLFKHLQVLEKDWNNGNVDAQLEW
jgi:hypothetical protein